MWNVEGTDEFSTFYVSLTDSQRDRVDAAVEQLVEHGSNLGKPLVDRIVGSRIHRLKELRPTRHRDRPSGSCSRSTQPTAILLLGGDKASNSEWSDWYATAVPVAESLYDIYLDETNQKD